MARRFAMLGAATLLLSALAEAVVTTQAEAAGAAAPRTAAAAQVLPPAAGPGAVAAAAEEPVLAASLLSQGLAQDLSRHRYGNAWQNENVPSRAYRELLMEDSQLPLRRPAMEPAALASDSLDDVEGDGLEALKRREQHLEGSVRLASQAWRDAQAALYRYSARERAVEREEVLERRARLRLERIMQRGGGLPAPAAVAPAPLVRRAPRRALYTEPAAASEAEAEELGEDVDEDPRLGGYAGAERLDDWPRMRQQTRYRRRASELESSAQRAEGPLGAPAEPESGSVPQPLTAGPAAQAAAAPPAAALAEGAAAAEEEPVADDDSDKEQPSQDAEEASTAEDGTAEASAAEADEAAS